MGKKANFNKAVFDMFGVGAAPENETVQAEAAVPAVQTAPTAQDISCDVQRGEVAEPVYAAPYTLVPATFLSPGSVLEGKLTSRGDVELAGSFHGELCADGNVTLRADATCNITAASLTVTNCHLIGDCTVSGLVSISDHSTVTGNITADELVCSGNIVGDIAIKGTLALESTACITGNITANSMSMARGAAINGTISIEHE